MPACTPLWRPHLLASEAQSSSATALPLGAVGRRAGTRRRFCDLLDWSQATESSPAVTALIRGVVRPRASGARQNSSPDLTPSYRNPSFTHRARDRDA